MNLFQNSCFVLLSGTPRPAGSRFNGLSANAAAYAVRLIFKLKFQIMQNQSGKRQNQSVNPAIRRHETCQPWMRRTSRPNMLVLDRVTSATIGHPEINTLDLFCVMMTRRKRSRTPSRKRPTIAHNNFSSTINFAVDHCR